MPDSLDTIGNDVSDYSDDGADAFLAHLQGEELPKRKEPLPEHSEEGTPDGGEETPDEAVDTSGEEGAGDGANDSQEPDPEDQEFEIKVGDKTEKAKLKDLKRLFGQEASLTQKSQKLAESQRAADARFQTANAALTKLLEKAQAKFDQYAGVDFLSLTAQVGAGQIDQATFDAIRGDHAIAEAELKFVREELGTLMQQQRDESAKAYREAATECLKVLSDEKTGIPGWGKELYEEMGSFAASQGIPIQAYKSVTDPVQLKIVHMAMQWQKGEAARVAAEKARKAAEAKVNAAPNKPTRVMRPGGSQANGNGKQQQAMKVLRQRGDLDSTTDAFLASFK